MRRTFYLTASLLFLGGGVLAQGSGTDQVPKREVQELDPSDVEVSSPRRGGSHSAQRATGCDGDTVFYEDFSNGFSGSNSHSIGWDTSGTYQVWRECNNVCQTNGTSFDVSPYMSSPTQSNGVVNMDIQWKAGYIFGPGQSPPTEPEGPAPEQYMTMDSIINLDSLKAPVVTLHTAFAHCCAVEHKVLLEVDTNLSGSWDTKFDISASASRNQLETGKFVYHIGPGIQGSADSVRLRFTWPDTGPDANGQVSGIYSWYIDDVVIKEANRNDLEMENTAYTPTNSGLNQAGATIEYSQIPRCFMDSLDLGGQICNVGRNDLTNVRLQASVYNSMGAQIYQTTSSSFNVDSLSCIGGNVAGYRPPGPDTVWANKGFFTRDTGTYRVEYKAITDTADCDTTNNFGPLEEFQVSRNTYALDDCYNGGDPSGQVVSPSSGNSFTTANVFNTFEFTWGDPNLDTVKAVSFYVHDTTQVGAGPITVGISGFNGSGVNDTTYRVSNDYFIKAKDIGTWVTRPLVKNSNGSNVGGLPVPVDNAQKAAFVKYPGGSERVGYGTCGTAQDFHSYVKGDFGGAGDQLYATGDIPLVRVKMNERSTINRTACDSFTVPSGNNTYYSSGLYRDTLAGFNGCDSIHYVDLTIKNSTSATIQTSACSQYTVPSGDETYSSDGTYMDTVPNSVGCDSLLTIDLSIGSVDTLVNYTRNLTDTLLEARKVGADSYQWVDCNDGYSEVNNPTANDRVLDMDSAGTYAVIISNDGCTDTSNCHSVQDVGIGDFEEENSAELYPNPTTGQFTLDLGEAGRDVRMKITDLQGRTIKSQDHIDSRRVQFELDQPEGIYMVHLSSGDKSEVIKLVKE